MHSIAEISNEEIQSSLSGVIVDDENILGCVRVDDDFVDKIEKI